MLFANQLHLCKPVMSLSYVECRIGEENMILFDFQTFETFSFETSGSKSNKVDSLHLAKCFQLLAGSRRPTLIQNGSKIVRTTLKNSAMRILAKREKCWSML